MRLTRRMRWTPTIARSVGQTWEKSAEWSVVPSGHAAPGSVPLCVCSAKALLALSACSLLVGCGSVTWRAYHGPQNWATGPGLSSETKDGLVVYEGLPDVPYELLGIVEAQGPASPLIRPDHRRKMHETIWEHGGNGMILVGREIIRTGSYSSYSGSAYSSGGGMAHGSGGGSASDTYNYALAVLAIRTVDAGGQAESGIGCDPVEWARSVLVAGTALLGSEMGK